jgi:hypothetical protein
VPRAGERKRQQQRGKQEVEGAKTVKKSNKYCLWASSFSSRFRPLFPLLGMNSLAAKFVVDEPSLPNS